MPRGPVLTVFTLVMTVAAAYGQPLPVIHNLTAWFDSGIGVTTTGGGTDNVTAWADQSGNGNHASPHNVFVNEVNPTYVLNALNGRPVIRFDGDFQGDHLVMPNNSLDLSGGLTVFAVARNAVRKNYNGLFRLGPAGNPFNTTSAAEIYWQAGGTDAASGNAAYVANRPTFPSPYGDVIGHNAGPAVGTYYLYDLTATSGSASHRLDGVVPFITSSGDTFVPTSAGFGAIGIGFGVLEGSLNGDIAELIIYDTALNFHERNYVGHYLSAKYGLSTPYFPEPSAMALISLGLSRCALRRRRIDAR